MEGWGAGSALAEGSAAGWPGGCQAGSFAHHPAQITATAAQAGRPLIPDVQSNRPGGREGGTSDQALLEHKPLNGAHSSFSELGHWGVSGDIKRIHTGM